MKPMFDVNSSQLALIYYPSGGYGFYLTRLINLAIKDVVHTNDPLTFDDLGTSHSCPTVVPSISSFNFKEMFLFIKPEYQTQVSTGLPIVLPVCPGSTENHQIYKIFPNAKIIKITYSDISWPLVFYNCIYKAQKNINIDDGILFDQHAFGKDTPSARRENYKLFLQNSPLRSIWAQTKDMSVDVFDLVTNPIQTLTNLSQVLNSTTQNLDLVRKVHEDFLQTNPIINTWLEIKNIVDNITASNDLSGIIDLYWQSVFDFYVEEKYQIEIPVDDYPNWFTHTEEVVTMLRIKGVCV